VKLKGDHSDFLLRITLMAATAAAQPDATGDALELGQEFQSYRFRFEALFAQPAWIVEFRSITAAAIAEDRRDDLARTAFTRKFDGDGDVDRSSPDGVSRHRASINQQLSA
jgi:hypothetical protein